MSSVYAEIKRIQHRMRLLLNARADLQEALLPYFSDKEGLKMPGFNALDTAFDVAIDYEAKRLVELSKGETNENTSV